MNSVKTPADISGCYNVNLLPLGKFLANIKHICLSSAQKMPIFYLNYTFYSGLLIFCCQSVATLLLYVILGWKSISTTFLSHRQTESFECFAQLIFVALFHSWKNSSNVRYRSALLQLTALDAT